MPELSRIDPRSAALLVMDYQVDITSCAPSSPPNRRCDEFPRSYQCQR
jgi:hypothetical protein